MARISKKKLDELLATGTAEMVSATRQPLGGIRQPAVTTGSTQSAMPPPSYLLSGTFYADIHIKSEMNMREHWAARKKRFDTQSAGVRWAVSELFLKAVGNWMHTFQSTGRVRVTLTRIGRRKLDDDNLAGGFKAVRDRIAEMIGVDDGSDWFAWEYRQVTGKEYGVRIEISTEAA